MDIEVATSSERAVLHNHSVLPHNLQEQSTLQMRQQEIFAEPPQAVDVGSLCLAISQKIIAGKSANRIRPTRRVITANLFLEMRINLYRIVQESLMNIMKHAQATRIDARIERTGRLMVLTIQDDGVGFTPGGAEKSAGKGGFGLSGMAERAQLLGGVFRAISAPGHGTSLRVDINAGG
jgi:signal transduction histidine kinase